MLFFRMFSVHKCLKIRPKAVIYALTGVRADIEGRRFMPRKPLDVSKERVRLSCQKANQNPPKIFIRWVACFALNALLHAHERLVSSGTWNK